MLSISERTVDYMIADGRLEILRIGSRVLIRAASLDRLLKARKIDTGSGNHNHAA